MKHIRVTGNALAGYHRIVALGEGEKKQDEDAVNTVMQTLRMVAKSDLMNSIETEVFDYMIPITL